LIAQNVNIISTEQVEKKILIKYNNMGISGKYDVKLFIRPSNSLKWSNELISLTGDVGFNQAPGRNKVILWDVINDRENLVGEYVFGIQANNLSIIEKLEKENQKTLNLEEKERKKSLKCKTGPINAYLSLIYPGLGTYNVGSKQTGIKKMKAFTLFAATTIISKLYSNYSYNNYLSSTDQSEIDNHYQSANVSNKIFLGSLLVSACFYIEDFTFSLKRGRWNRERSKLQHTKRIDYNNNSSSGSSSRSTGRKVNRKL
tara:strand:+ start:8755 stop:9528 length:774 start_codon:yes stop_codon:yes gene_type:complete